MTVSSVSVKQSEIQVSRQWITRFTGKAWQLGNWLSDLAYAGHVTIGEILERKVSAND